MEHPNESQSTEKPKRKWLKFITNRYVLAILFFGIWMLFLDNYSWLVHSRLDKEINELETNKKYYQDEIRSDMRQIKLMQDTNEVERYAREKYFMKRDSEDIYIIEYESDIKDSIKLVPKK